MNKARSLKRAFNVKDDYYTPRILVEPLIPYLDDFFCIAGNNPPRSRSFHTIYYPFDTEQSEYVIVLKEAGFNVIYGDIKTGQDFFEKPIPQEAGIVVSNIPFSQKKRIFERCFAEDKPFCLLCNLMAANYNEITNLFRETEELGKEPVQFLIPDKKVSFDGNTSSFNSAYFTWRFVGRTQYFHLQHDNKGKNYVPASAYRLQKGF